MLVNDLYTKEKIIPKLLATRRGGLGIADVGLRALWCKFDCRCRCDDARYVWMINALWAESFNGEVVAQRHVGGGLCC